MNPALALPAVLTLLSAATPLRLEMSQAIPRIDEPSFVAALEGELNRPVLWAGKSEAELSIAINSEGVATLSRTGPESRLVRAERLPDLASEAFELLVLLASSVSRDEAQELIRLHPPVALPPPILVARPPPEPQFTRLTLDIGLVFAPGAPAIGGAAIPRIGLGAVYQPSWWGLGSDLSFAMGTRPTQVPIFVLRDGAMNADQSARYVPWRLFPTAFAQARGALGAFRLGAALGPGLMLSNIDGSGVSASFFGRLRLMLGYAFTPDLEVGLSGEASVATRNDESQAGLTLTTKVRI